MELLVILHISIHALREEGDAFSAGASCFCAISIHALREEGDLPGLFLTLLILLFLSTPSARRATLSQGRFLAEESISIHALRERATECVRANIEPLRISIHALREEGDGLRL